MILGIIISNRKKSEKQQMVETIPIRISINGIKGKSTITRLVTNILIESGYKVVGKTTGTSSKMIYWFQDNQSNLDSKLQTTNSNDELSVLKNAVDIEAEAIVYENVDADYKSKKAPKFKLLNENIAVIANISEDYLEEDDKIVQSFAEIIPYDGYLITINSNYTDYFKQVARERDTKVITANNSKITYAYLDLFDYDVSVENAALALAVGQALGIDEKTCLRGMVNIEG